jgi:hypothetical protein
MVCWADVPGGAGSFLFLCVLDRVMSLWIWLLFWAGILAGGLFVVYWLVT